MSSSTLRSCQDLFDVYRNSFARYIFPRRRSVLILSLLLRSATQISLSRAMSNMRILSVALLAHLVVMVLGDKEIEVPSVFNRRGKVQHCEDNGVVHAWCDSLVFEEIECGLLPEFDEYGCQCFRDPSKCPSECIDGSELIEKTHYGIRCRKLPMDDSPNYILKEYHAMGGCEENSLVAAWWNAVAQYTSLCLY
mmetsp:Transcript_3149/g.4770  ORF Transcript_3149/g.4770 Transcript_3149/m.4770 type:complete len:194 (+) Transcript_3149:3-584(+)